jgi:hypothetical protein
MSTRAQQDLISEIAKKIGALEHRGIPRSEMEIVIGTETNKTLARCFRRTDGLIPDTAVGLRILDVVIIVDAATPRLHAVRRKLKLKD